MTTAEFRDILDREPFQPIRVRLTGGDVYEIRNPGLAFPMRTRLFVASPDSDHWTLIPYLHIAAIDTIGNGDGK